MRNGEGRCGHDDGRSVTFSHDGLKMVTGRQWDGNGTVTVTGQNHNFYSTSIDAYLTIDPSTINFNLKSLNLFQFCEI